MAAKGCNFEDRTDISEEEEEVMVVVVTVAVVGKEVVEVVVVEIDRHMYLHKDMIHT